MRIGPPGSGAVTDPLAGMQMPPGDPGPLDGTAGNLGSWAQTLSGGAGSHRSAASSVIGTAWTGNTANQAGTTITALATASDYLSNGSTDAASALQSCASKWSAAKALWQKAQALAAQAVAEETVHRQAGATAAASPATMANPTALAPAQAAADGSDGFVSPARAQAATLGTEAIADANRAINAAIASAGNATAQIAVLGPDPVLYYLTNLNASPADLNLLTIAQREAFVSGFEAKWGPQFFSTKMFTNIEGVLHFFGDQGQGKPGDWVSWVDATILFGFERGAADALPNLPTNPGLDSQDPTGVANWTKYFQYMKAAGPGGHISQATEYQLWANGEEPSTHTGYAIAAAHGQTESVPDYMFANLGAEGYRQIMLHFGAISKFPVLGPMIGALVNPQNYGPTYYGGNVVYGAGQVIEGSGNLAAGYATNNPVQEWNGLKEAGTGIKNVVVYGTEGAGDLAKTAFNGAVHEGKKLFDDATSWIP